MLGTDSGIAFDHTEILPSAEVANRDQVDALHHAVARPMVAPVVDAEVLAADRLHMAGIARDQAVCVRDGENANTVARNFDALDAQSIYRSLT